ncbi:hypothetical protein [Bartonella sp. WD16.2]|nr:hypothetical protein [Bartonella sp. WD16.2]
MVQPVWLAAVVRGFNEKSYAWRGEALCVAVEDCACLGGGLHGIVRKTT